MTDEQKFLAEVDVSVALILDLITPSPTPAPYCALGQVLRCVDGLPEGAEFIEVYQDPLRLNIVTLVFAHSSFRGLPVTSGLGRPGGRLPRHKLHVTFDRETTEIAKWPELLMVAEKASVMIGTPANTAQMVFNLAFWSILELNGRMQGDADQRGECLEDLYSAVADMLCAIRYLEVEKQKRWLSEQDSSESDEVQQEL